MRGMFSVWVCYSQPFWRTEAAAQKSHCARSRSCNVGPRAAERGLGRCCGPRGSLWGPQGKAGEVDGRAPRRGRLNARNQRLERVNNKKSRFSLYSSKIRRHSSQTLRRQCLQICRAMAPRLAAASTAGVHECSHWRRGAAMLRAPRTRACAWKEIAR